jgi:hypothetical protein
MFVFPRYREWAAKDPGVSFIVTGPEIAANPEIDVSIKTSSSTFDLEVTERSVVNGVMFVHARAPIGHATLTSLGFDGGVGTITVTVRGTGQSITADSGYGGPPPPMPPTGGPPPVGPPGAPPSGRPPGGAPPK